MLIGAGPAGLATAAMLQRRGVRAVVLERSDVVGGKFRGTYDRFRLNTYAGFSHAPGRRFRKGEGGRWPARDEVVQFYEDYARERRLEIRLQTEACRVEQDKGSWEVLTNAAPISARAVVIATARDAVPFIPPWAGTDSYAGRLLHSSEYRNARPFTQSDVLVVGAGNSAMDIAVDLAEGGAGRVALAVRTVPNLVVKALLGVPFDVFSVIGARTPTRVLDAMSKAQRRLLLGDLSPFGLPTPTDGPVERLRRTGMVPMIDTGAFAKAVKRGAISVVAGVADLDEQGAVLVDGTKRAVDCVIAATGYRPDLASLVGHLGVLDQEGYPVIDGPRTLESLPGLRFVGFSEPPTGALRQIRIDSKRVARGLARSLRARS